MTTKSLNERLAAQILSISNKLEKTNGASRISDLVAAAGKSATLRKLKGIVDEAVATSEEREEYERKKKEQEQQEREQEDQKLIDMLRELPTYKKLNTSELRKIVQSARTAAEPTKKLQRKKKKSTNDDSGADQHALRNESESAAPGAITTENPDHQQAGLEPADQTASGGAHYPHNQNTGSSYQ